MANITLTVDDDQLPVLRLAYGVKTDAELRDAMITHVKQPYVDYVYAQTEAAETAKVTAALEAKSEAIKSAVAEAQALEIT